LGPDVGIRTESFGYLAYVGDRDHFFAIDHVGARVVDAEFLLRRPNRFLPEPEGVLVPAQRAQRLRYASHAPEGGGVVGTELGASQRQGLFVELERVRMAAEGSGSPRRCGPR